MLRLKKESFWKMTSTLIYWEQVFLDIWVGNQIINISANKSLLSSVSWFYYFQPNIFSSNMSSHLMWCMHDMNKQCFFYDISKISLLTPLSKQILHTLTLSSDRNCRSEIVTFITWAGVVTTYWVKVLLIHCWNWVIYYRVASHKEMMISSWANAP